MEIQYPEIIGQQMDQEENGKQYQEQGSILEEPFHRGHCFNGKFGRKYRNIHSALPNYRVFPLISQPTVFCSVPILSIEMRTSSPC